MAMKLTPAEKKIDSQIRAFNSQIEKAYKTLGYNHNVTRNLVSTARSLFGSEFIKEMTPKSINRNQIDLSTGEVHMIPQIARTRKALDYAKTKTREFEMVTGNKPKYTSPAERLQRITHNASGNIKNIYDVSKARQNAIEREMQRRRTTAINQGMFDDMSMQDKFKAINDYQQAYTNNDITRQLYLDTIATDIFEKYKQAKSSGDDDIDDFLEFADMFNHGKNTENIDSILENAMIKRDATLHHMGYTDNELQRELEQGQSLIDYLDYL